MPYVITDACVDVMDRTCVDQCPVDCIYQGERMLYINPDECIDCAACEPVCPQQAIYNAEELPEERAGFVLIKAEFFQLGGAPTAPAGEGAAGEDHPTVKALPPNITTQ
jgi:NAD-dependent dihydropyrimidine dehydrogenase PreA subunit